MENDETFVYKCPNCGGKVDYDELNHKWTCHYCNNSYEALFASKESVALPTMDDIKYTYYCYLCDTCHSKFLSSEKENAICLKCNNQCFGQGTPTTISKVLDIYYSISQANDIYFNAVRKFKNRINSEYLKKDLQLEYINCDLYNGSIRITNEKNAKKYIFMNLLIPNIEYDDYRFMYEVGNMGIKNSREYLKENKNGLEARIQQEIQYFTNVEDINYVNSIVEACINDFKNNFGVVNEVDIKIENNLSVSEGVYIPVYKKTVDNENQYVFGNYYAMKEDIIQFPEEKDSRFKTKLYKSLSSLFTALIVMSIVGIFVSFTIYRDFILYCLLILIISIILSFVFDNKYNYYVRTIKISKKDYFEQIINNSNYVKGIKVKK